MIQECFDLYEGDSDDAKMAQVAAKVAHFPPILFPVHQSSILWTSTGLLGLQPSQSSTTNMQRPDHKLDPSNFFQGCV